MKKIIVFAPTIPRALIIEIMCGLKLVLNEAVIKTGK
jgi:hypothetical protein